MNLLIVFCLMLLWGQVQAEPDLQLFFPENAIEIDGVFADRNEALMVRRINGQTYLRPFDLAAVTGVNIPDHASVTGFTARKDGLTSSSISYLFALDVSVDGYPRNSVIECSFQACQLQQQFAVGSANISSLEWINRTSDLILSFDQWVNINGQVWEPSNAYRASDSTKYFDGQNQGMNQNSRISAYDRSEFEFTFSADSANDLMSGPVKASEVYSDQYTLISDVTASLTDQAGNIQAYFSADTGWLSMADIDIAVLENAGSVNLVIQRLGGHEYVTTAVLADVDGTAVDGVDYNGVFNQFFWIDGNDNDIVVSIDLLDNDQPDGDKTFTVELIESNSNHAFSLVDPDRQVVTITIIDDETSDLIFADGFQ